MPPQSTPRHRIEAACARQGQPAVVAGCVRLLTGADPDPAFVRVLGGAHADTLLAGALRDDQEYWLRVWAARGLLWAWQDDGLPGLRAALVDPAWRVREMAAKVIARHLVAAVFDEVAALRSDPVPRVRTAATRAVRELTAAGT